MAKQANLCCHKEKLGVPELYKEGWVNHNPNWTRVAWPVHPGARARWLSRAGRYHGQSGHPGWGAGSGSWPHAPVTCSGWSSHPDEPVGGGEVGGTAHGISGVKCVMFYFSVVIMLLAGSQLQNKGTWVNTTWQRTQLSVLWCYPCMYTYAPNLRTLGDCNRLGGLWKASPDSPHYHSPSLSMQLSSPPPKLLNPPHYFTYISVMPYSCKGWLRQKHPQGHQQNILIT